MKKPTKRAIQLRVVAELSWAYGSRWKRKLDPNGRYARRRIDIPQNSRAGLFFTMNSRPELSLWDCQIALLISSNTHAFGGQVQSGLDAATIAFSSANVLYEHELLISSHYCEEPDT